MKEGVRGVRGVAEASGGFFFCMERVVVCIKGRQLL
jgi:hypothetical protein